ncbi:MAG: sigma-70 family RNA polymerase sigma factor [Clostridia bacterium]|nr:sigma-70 family RNA polymerase sigma factor [Clostridia bacterium]
MKRDIIDSYAEKVYGYAVKRTYSREEAEELAQEILFTAVRDLHKLRDADKLEPWLWGIAGNVTKSFRRDLGKRRATYSYDTLENLSYEEKYFDDREEIYASLRTKVAMLSAIYRDIVVLHYYDGLSTKAISERLGLPEGTVRWRLSEARKKLKKEGVEMKETALRPKKMRLNIYGNGDYNGVTVPFPFVYIDDALSQNILYYCYEKPGGVEELAALCGVPAYYIEDRIENLLRREAIVEATKGKYLTDFVIWSDKHGIWCEENAERMLMPLMDKLLCALEGIAEDASRIEFYKAGKSEGDLFYLYGAMAFAYASEHYCKLPYPWFKKKYDGNEWCYIGSTESGTHRRMGIGIQHSANLGSRGGCSHTVYNGFGGIKLRQMMYDNYVNVCEDILLDGKTADVESAANAIRDGYIVKRQDGSFFVTVPFFTIEQKAEFDAIADRHLAPLMPEYSDVINGFVSGYKKLFPKHLGDDADRLCHNTFMGAYEVIIGYAQRTGAIAMPSPSCYCDVLVQFKET